MTATSNCKPWCTDHQGADECYTRFVIYDKGDEEKAEPTEGSLAAQFKAFGGLPVDISWIAFVAAQDEEDEQPVMDLQFYETEGDEPNSTLHLDMEALKELHSNFGAILKNFS